MTEQEFPLRQARFNGTIISDPAALNNSVAVVFSNNSGVYLSVVDLGQGTAVNSAVQLQIQPASNALLRADSTSGLLLVGISNVVYAVQNMQLQGTVLLDSDVVCIQADPNGLWILAASEAQLFALSSAQLLVTWTYTFAVPINLCPVLLRSEYLLFGVNSVAVLDPMTGFLISSSGINLYCANGLLALSPQCDMLCQSSSGALVSFNVLNMTQTWIAPMFSVNSILDIVVDKHGNIAFLYSDPSAKGTLYLSVNDSRLGILWEATLRGVSGSLAVTSDNRLIVRVDNNGNPPSYIYAYGERVCASRGWRERERVCVCVCVCVCV